MNKHVRRFAHKQCVGVWTYKHDIPNEFQELSFKLTMNINCAIKTESVMITS